MMTRPYRIGWVLAALAIVVRPTVVSGHAGHKALPTKGAQVDVERGLITLSPEAQKALAITTAEVELRPADHRILAYVTLVPTWQSHAFATSQIAGRVGTLHVNPGQTVKKGQPLADVESPELAELQLEFRNAYNDVVLGKKTLEQIKALADKQIIAGKELGEAGIKLRESTNALEIARAKLLSLGLTEKALQELLDNRDGALVRSLPIVSPIDGTIIHTDIATGQVVEPDEHLFEIMDSTTISARVDVLEQDLQSVEVGQAIELRLSAYPDRVFHTTIQVKGLSIDPTTHLGPIWGELKNSADAQTIFLPGMNGEAQIQVSKPIKQMTIPAAALLGDGAERYVLVVEAANDQTSQYRKQNVVVAADSPEFVQLSGGSIFPGDRVVVTGSHELATYFFPSVLKLSPEAEKNINLKVEEAAARPIEQIVELDGAVDVPPNRRGSVSSQVAGTLQRILVDRSQPVHAGDVVAEIASLELQNMQMEFLRAHLEGELLAESLARLKALDQNQLASRRKLWETESAYNAEVNRRERSMRKLQAAGVSSQQIDALLKDKKLLKTFPLRAPIDGVVVDFDGFLGKSVKPNERLFEIHDLSHSWIRVDLSERELAKVRLEQPARVRVVSDPNFIGEGTVARSSGMLNSGSRTLSLWVELKQQPKTPLEHNMLARIALTVGQPESALSVPLGAIQREGVQTFVFVRKPDGVFERRSVDLGRSDDRFVEIKRGLSLGDAVAIRGTAGLQATYAVIR